MRILHLAMAGSLMLSVASLSACQTTSQVDNAIEQNLPKVCSAIEIAHVAFSAVAATGKLKAGTVSKEAAAYAGVETICADPSHTTVVDAVVKVAQAYAVVSSALQQAKAAQ
ncbi:cell wall anchor protein [Rhizobium sp. NXC24]|uniref:cell wall anchor protein n=1 Tax=Rhizobium sp. NXC24 TaxID=2048897 RepID=UPI0018F80FC7|nr:cell wall anchor protein [Rhizobium sp. NXC24]